MVKSTRSKLQSLIFYNLLLDVIFIVFREFERELTTLYQQIQTFRNKDTFSLDLEDNFVNHSRAKRYFIKGVFLFLLVAKSVSLL